MNNNIEVTLLSKEEILSNSRVLQKVGKECNYPYWTRTKSHPYCGQITNEIFTPEGEFEINFPCHYNGVRPVLKYDKSEDFIKTSKTNYENGIEVVEYGQYPDFKKRINISDISKLKWTKKYYYLVKGWPQYYSFTILKYPEYKHYNGNKFIYINNYFYKIKPVKFYVDKENNMLISKNILFFAPINIRFNNKKYNGDFKTSQLYKFLNNEFIRNLKPNKDITTLLKENQKLKSEIEAKKETLEKLREAIQENKELINQSNILNSEIEKELKGRSKVLKIF